MPYVLVEKVFIRLSYHKIKRVDALIKRNYKLSKITLGSEAGGHKTKEIKEIKIL